MKLVVRLMKPKNQKEQMFKAETFVDDIKNPAESSLTLDGKEYRIEVYYEYPKVS
jgi:hypothetical protein